MRTQTSSPSEDEVILNREAGASLIIPLGNPAFGFAICKVLVSRSLISPIRANIAVEE